MFLNLQVYALGHYLFSVVDAKMLQRIFVAAAILLVSGVAAILVAAQLLGLVQWTGRSLTLLDPTYASKYVFCMKPYKIIMNNYDFIRNNGLV